MVIHMKKKTTSTFVLNMSDTVYAFVERKKDSFYGSLYNVYYKNEEEPVLYTANNFVTVHGIHQKMTVNKFAEQAVLSLAPLQNKDKEMNYAFQVFDVIGNITKNNNPKNPKIGRFKTHLLKAIEIYNNNIALMDNSPLISYEENYKLVNSKRNIKEIKQINVKETEERKLVKQISNSYDDTKSIQRKLKYE